jgi:hypothetical protein
MKLTDVLLAQKLDMAVAILQSAIEAEEGNWDGPHDPYDESTEPAWMESARALITELAV